MDKSKTKIAGEVERQQSSYSGIVIASLFWMTILGIHETVNIIWKFTNWNINYVLILCGCLYVLLGIYAYVMINRGTHVRFVWFILITAFSYTANIIEPYLNYPLYYEPWTPNYGKLLKVGSFFLWLLIIFARYYYRHGYPTIIKYLKIFRIRK